MVFQEVSGTFSGVQGRLRRYVEVSDAFQMISGGATGFSEAVLAELHGIVRNASEMS